MTMDVNNRKSEITMKNEEQTQISTSKSPTKRSFDVAFLMLPDEKLKQKQKFSKVIDYEVITSNEEMSSFNNNENDSEDEDIEVGNPDSPKIIDYTKLPSKYITQKQQIFDDPNLSKPKPETKIKNILMSPEKSAFTKVSLTKEMRMSSSPNLSISPDIAYQNSLSPSPPINRNYQNFPSNMIPPNQIFKSNSYHHNFIPENFPQSTGGLEPHFLMKTNHQELQKIRPMMLTQYRPDYYHQVPNQEMLKLAQPDLKFSSEMRHPAAAILTSLLPPSLAALSLPAQNVCAKCNISFRMTSDLVYHMRSHHKNDSGDYTKRKREEKLKCPVCQESFRERHHLTRHMTAHQDKDNDDEEIGKKNNFPVGYNK
ncbi:uncharacterized protein [Onthophagus taurus]|uniref:uncharacterized protein n=1 Tax=Onthophagus taurus TaxID=166361 RepID=UPI000C204D41|nr:uncharacterized protein LOC111414986 [Onthophagus taurus]